MKLTQLRYFIEVCNCLNITLAAKNLHISQPSLTVAIKNLETELGVSLFHRVKQRIYLTTEGEFFYQKLSPILSDLDQLVTETVTLGKNDNIIKIGIPPMMGSFLFPQIFSKFMELNPNIKLEIKEHGGLKIQELLLNESLDLTLLLKESQINKEITFKPIEKRHLRLCINSNHKLAKKKSVNFLDLKNEPLILFNTEFYISKVVHNFFKKKNIEPNIVLETTQVSTIERFIHKNLAASILIDGCLSEDDGIAIKPIDDIGSITIGLAWKKNHFITNSVKKMINFIDSQY